MNKNKILITCSKGVAPVLAKELNVLGFPVLATGNGAVETEGDRDAAMLLNLQLRTGLRVLMEVGTFRAATPEELSRRVKALPWERMIPVDGYLSVTSSVRMEEIRDQRFASLKCKDAIVDRIREKTARRPDSGADRDRSVVHLYWTDGAASVYLDTTGEPLSRRGYRKIPLAAPLQETLAAAVVLETGWNGGGNFVNPLCGSGTLAIEAALIGLNRAPGLFRSNFGFMHLVGYDEGAWKRLREKARKASLKELGGRIIATDNDPSAIEGARKNAATAGVDHLIEFGVCDFADTDVPPGGGAVVMNPEYGERLGDVRTLEAVYGRIGDFLKQTCQGYRGYVFTGNPDLAKKIGLKTKRKIPFWNSSIECRLLEYELYAGSRKQTVNRQETTGPIETIESSGN